VELHVKKYNSTAAAPNRAYQYRSRLPLDSFPGYIREAATKAESCDREQRGSFWIEYVDGWGLVLRITGQ
jgi:hypothetical protein